MSKLIILMLIQNFVIGKILLPPHDDDDVILFNNMMRDLFNNCRKEFGTIGIWGNQPSFLKDGAMDVVLSNNDWPYEIPFLNIKSFVIFIDDLFHDFPFIETREGDRRGLIILFVFDRGGYYSKDNLTDLFSTIGGEDYTLQNTLLYYCYVSNERKIEILTANSYADFAPANWVKVQELSFDYYLWHLNLRIYKTLYPSSDNTTDSEFCNNIFFDRTRYLFGYTINAAYVSTVNDTDNFDVEQKKSMNQLINRNTPTNEIVELLGEECGNYSLWLIESLNISLNITIHFSRLSDEEDFSRWHELSLIKQYLSLQPLPQSIFNHDYICISYPIQYFHDVIVTPNRGLMSALEKMFEFYGWVTIIATIIILSITFLVIYQSNNQEISFALFECLRLIISYKIETRIDYNGMRIFFSVIFLYFLIIQATFSGHLAAFLTKPVYKKNVETLEDLKDPHYRSIYVPLRLFDSEFITDKLLMEKLINTDFFKNYWLIDDNGISLIDYEEKLNPLILEYNLHKSKSHLKFDFSILVMPGNWGLRERVNKVVMKWTESHVLTRWHENNNQSIRRKFEIIQDRAENYYRPVEFRDLCFAFIFLAFGLLSGVLCFVIELLYRIILAVGKKIIQFQFLTLKIIFVYFQIVIDGLFDFYDRD